jgi:uncharacterized protein (DUF488 family)
VGVLPTVDVYEFLKGSASRQLKFLTKGTRGRDKELKSKVKEQSQVTVFTVGHSTRSADDFVRVLKAHRIELLVDVRSFPGSRRLPHFNKESLKHSLEPAGVEYEHMPQLGGRRKASPDSKNTAWMNAGFRGYADYMETEAFRQGIDELLKLANSKRTAVMCAEAVWWRCHRSLIADYLKSNGVDVLHLIDEKKSEPHPYTSAARIIDGKLSYEGLLTE